MVADRLLRTLGVLALTSLGLSVGVVSTVVAASAEGADAARVALHTVSGVLFLAAGALAHARRPDNGVGPLMVAVGIGWFAEDLKLSMIPWLYTIGLVLGTASAGFLAHLVLAFPTGARASRWERTLVASAYAMVFAVGPAAIVFADPRPIDPDRPNNLLLVADRPDLAGALTTAQDLVGALIAVALVVQLCRRWVVASAPRRRVLAPVFVTGLVGGLASAASLILPASGWRVASLWLFDIAFCALPLGFLAGVLRVRLGRTRVGELILHLRHPMPADELRAVLAHALGDASLEVGYWADEHTLVGAAGQPVSLPADGQRTVTMVERGGRPIAALLHDPAAAEDRHVLDAITAAAALALDNQRLAAQVAAQLTEVRASRARIVEAADAERRRLERDLHDGAQQRLVVALVSLRQAERDLAPGQPSARGEPESAPGREAVALVTRGTDELELALRELREFARGIHPAVLTEAGLPAAVETLAQRCPLPVRLSAPEMPRLAVSVEMTAYFVVAEALTNALRHAAAHQVEVILTHSLDRLTVRVADDGQGDARIGDGGGLFGLRDRVRAVDGELTVDSRPGHGTTLTAQLPL